MVWVVRFQEHDTCIKIICKTLRILVLDRESLRSQVRFLGVELVLKQAEIKPMFERRRPLRPMGVVLDDAVLAPPGRHIRVIAGRGFLAEFGLEVIAGKPFVRLKRLERGCGGGLLGNGLARSRGRST